MNTNSAHSLEERVRAITSDMLVIPLNEVLLGSRFVADFGADSLDVVELSMAFEDEFDIDISDDDAEKLVTVQHVVDFLRVRLEQRAAARYQVRDQTAAAPNTHKFALDSLSPLKLNWAVARAVFGKSHSYHPEANCFGTVDPDDTVAIEVLPDYCSDWRVGGPLLDRYQVSLEPGMAAGKITRWVAHTHGDGQGNTLSKPGGVGRAEDHLFAAMRAIVNYHFGDVVPIPDDIRDDDLD